MYTTQVLVEALLVVATPRELYLANQPFDDLRSLRTLTHGYPSLPCLSNYFQLARVSIRIKPMRLSELDG